MKTLEELVLENGTELENWACDLNENGEVESFGGISRLIAYKGKYYILITGTHRTKIYKDSLTEVIKKELTLGKDDFIIEMIINYEKKERKEVE